MTERFGKHAYLLVLNHTKSFTIKELTTDEANLRIFEIYDENEHTGQNWRGYDPHWDAVFGNVRTSYEIVDIGDDSIFTEGFFNTEINENGKKFRWSEKDCKLSLERYGGVELQIDFACPTDAVIEVRDVYGKVIRTFSPSSEKSLRLKVEHSTRTVGISVSKVFIPCLANGGDDNRQLGISINNFTAKR